jgi:hypothetical protein
MAIFPMRLRETAKSILPILTRSSLFSISHSIVLNSSNRQIYLVKSQYSVLAFQRHVELGGYYGTATTHGVSKSSAYGLVGIFR